MSSRKLDARPEADAGGPRLRTMERGVAVRASDAFVWAELDQSWCDQSWCGGVAALRLSARMVQNVTIRVLMIVVRALPSEPRRALTNEKGICGADETFSVIRDLSSSNV